ncbi:TPT-domain-containing protein [Laetiporus sulphureus 93-53]|uniref:TPT-domain-containing protein n=1 Tax=Laetiporus sulphureus 93-53 TaxID=1314785 RepID=A0A165DHR9_9APHY|nr:TPT-domain-containing protein [Laetiporus sulphureus 93-53]KZT04907.1 TPT-domain-containing protein [Laetiporus sulphureus 93-53]
MRPQPHLHIRSDLNIRPHYDSPGYDAIKSPQLGDPLSAFYAHELSGLRWQALRIQLSEDDRTVAGDGLLLHRDGLSPLLVPSNDAQVDAGQWAQFPPQTTHSVSSPRQRSGFPRNTATGIAESIPPSPVLSDSGLASPSLPVLSPQASERSKPATARKRKRTRFPLPAWLHSQVSWIALYFTFNLGLTLYNKLVLVRFPFPYTLTALHALCGTLGGWALRHQGTYVPARLTSRQHGVLAAFSVLYAVNIAVSNASLQLVTIPFHQVVRAATPIFTTALSMLLFGTHFSRLKIMTLLPVMAGVALATYGDYYFTIWGLLLTLLGTFLAALKTIYTNVLQSAPPLTSSSNTRRTPTTSMRGALLVPPRLALHPLDLLTRTSPLACALCLVYAYFSGELGRVRHSFAEEGVAGWARLLVLLGNGTIAFGLNVVSLSANKRIGALNMTVAAWYDLMASHTANVKQALTILCAVSLFQLTITPLNALGICVTLAGGAWYAWVEYLAKMEKKHGQRNRVLPRGISVA